MANIKITVEGPLMDGHKITFKAPCNCSVVDKLDVRYIKNNEQKNKLFTMKDAHGNDLTGLGNLFSEGAYVDVVLDPNSGSAYLQNAGTNGYLEEKTTPVDNLLSDRADLPLSAKQGKLLNDSLNDMFTFLGTSKKVEITTSIPSKVNTAIAKFTVPKNGLYAFLPQFKASFSEEGVLAVMVNTAQTPDYAVRSYNNSVIMYIPPDSVSACMNGIVFHNLKKDVTYYVVAYQTSSKTITIGNYSTFEIILFKET